MISPQFEGQPIGSGIGTVRSRQNIEPRRRVDRILAVRESFAQVLAVGGRSNSLGRTGDVIDAVLGDRVPLALGPLARLDAVRGVTSVMRVEGD